MKNVGLHFVYVTVILVSLVVGLITIQIGGSETVVGYISFAATIASLILAVLAIIYSFVSNANQSTFHSQINDATGSLGKTAAQLQASSDEISKRVLSIPALLSSVEASVNSSKELLMKIQGEKQNTKPEVPENTQGSSDQLELLLEYSSYLGTMALYISKVSFEMKQALPLAKLEEFFDEDFRFLHGYLSSLDAMGIVEYHLVDDVFTFTSFNERIARELPKFLKAKLSEPDFRIYGPETKKKIDIHFGIPGVKKKSPSNI